jgi:Amt family ammonium transporter
MPLLNRFCRYRAWLAIAALLFMLTAQSFGQASPAAAPAMATAQTTMTASEPATDPTGFGAPSLTPAGYNKPDPEKATTKDLATAIDAVATATGKTGVALNIVWTLVAGFLVMFMQAGFALVETGLCRAKNAAHVMSMNFLVYALGMTGFFVCGYAFMCGGSAGAPATISGGTAVLNQMVTISVGGHDWGLLGKKGFFLAGGSYDAYAIVWFLFMMVFMDTTATIPTGALAERWTFKSFFIYSLFIGGFLYPVYGCWVWGGGWLSQLGTNAGLAHGAVDFAGSGVVHMQGGMLALVCAWLLGPRIGKFDANGKPRAILGHNIPMVILGTFILAFGWFGFNAGSSLAADGRIGVTAVNTMLASASGALASCLYMWLVFGKPDPSMMCNGMLAGLVAITAPCAFVAPWAAFLIGGISGVLVVWSVFFWEKLGIDDPVGAISVHGINGAWGLIALGLFADGTYGEGYNGIAGNVTGLLYGGNGAHQFLAQLIDVGANATWNLLVGGAIFFVLGKVLGTNRVAPEIEIAGLDIPEMGAPGYPEYIEAMAPEQVPASEVAAAKAALAI